LDVVLVDDGAGPNFRHELIFADHLAVGRGQDQEKFKGPATKLHRDSIPRQPSPPEIEPEWTKGNLIMRHGSGTARTAASGSSVLNQGL
jgi:hypothetical protein